MTKKQPDKAEMDLKSRIAQEIRAAVDYDAKESAGKREVAVKYYLGDINSEVPAQPHRSTVISRDVSDVIGWMLPGIMRVFLASGRMVDFEPQDIEDEEYFEEASDHCNHIFMKENDGYRIVYDACHDSLLHGNGIVKVWCEEEESNKADYRKFGSVEEMAASGLAEADVKAMSEAEEGGYEVKAVKTDKRKRIKIEVIPRENFLIDAQATSIETARFTAQREEVSKSELVKRGFDRSKVEALPAFTERDSSLVDQARHDETIGLVQQGETATEEVELFECYIQSDVDGDGIAETVQVFYAGSAGAGEVLDWNVWDDVGVFYDIPCEPVPHRFEAISVFDQVREEQKIKTVLRRQFLDNLYQVNNPRPEVISGEVINMDSLTAPKYGQPIIKRSGSNPVTWQLTPFIGEKALAGLEYADQVIERRTGVSRSTMALDPEALQNQTATAVQASKDSAYSKIELIARNMAQGWSKVFAAILNLAHKHYGGEERNVRVNNKWVTGRPGEWNPEMAAVINTGLGAGSRDRDMAMLNVVAQGQQTLAAALANYGLMEKALEFLPAIRETQVKVAEAAGLKNADSYYPEFPPEQMMAIAQQMQERGDPAQAEAMQKAQMEQAKTAAELEQRREEQMLDAQLRQENMRIDAELKRDQMMMELDLKREQLSAELGLKREQLAAELALKREMASSTDIGDVRVGGEPG